MSSTTTEQDLASLDWTRRLIAVDTTSRNSNLELIDLVAAEVRRLGVEPLLVPNEDGAKANLFATFPAADGSTDGGIVISGHTDVVPVDGQDWFSDPFSAQIRDGRLYGRGAADMKSYIGAALTLLPRLAEADLSTPVHLALSYDEEIGCVGGGRLVAELERRGIRPEFCIVGEPTSMRVIAEHKSVNVFRATFTGVAAHSSLTPDGVNAIHHASRFAVAFAEMVDGWRENGPFDPGYVVPFSTGGVNLVHGGIASNTVPDRCVLEFEFRSVAAVDAAEVTSRVRAALAEIDARMRAEDPRAGVAVEVIGQVPGLRTPPGSAVLGLGADLGGLPSEEKVTYGTEAGQFTGIGIGTIVCGPGDIAQAHTADEWIELDQIAACEKFFDALLARVTA
ncbi:acetylornithine deacetylase (ArgE) [Tersicoccus phoenicis]|uniref:Acetylornithine deacetylase (ArgE) n=1 Tax=Tersicoccus phoenicis TaxID=554083 RepID=A0A1R1L729_9MICC|nr:acetylornithine deacetylase [Tersicoccus phoenicis]OMH23336.1 acetylornithine deacetylase (ArgE) [Tersicoccus phoenicis]